MPKKKPDKKMPCLETVFRNVLVCKKNSLKPYTEIFIQEPENISLENLGTIAGILDISDESEDSSYIVNYLISVIKKEYFSHAKRGPIESFEAALHKANLALAKLAEHENIGWIGKINAIVLVIEKNNIHLSQAGSAHAFLLRGKTMTDISEGAETSAAPNPLKTFVDVLSGRLEKDDKFIITTEHIFEIFSFEEIKRSAIKFSYDEFVQFLKTALGNELERSAVLVAEVKEKEMPVEIPAVEEKISPVNAFSQAAFSKKPKRPRFSPKNPNDLINAEEKQNIVKDVKEELAKKNGNFVDKKTGHIYIREDSFLKEETSLLGKFRDSASSIFSIFKKNTQVILQRGKNIKLPERKKSAETEKSAEIKVSKLLLFWNKFLPILKESARKTLLLLIDAAKFVFRNILILIYKFKRFFAERKNKEAIYHPAENSIVPSKSYRFLPNFSKIKNILSKMDYSQRLYAVLAILFLLVAPYLIIRIQKNAPETTAVQETARTLPPPLESDKNVVRISDLSQTDLGQAISQTINLNDKIFAIGENGIIDSENKSSYPFPENFSPVKTVAGMDDLNLIFILNKDNKILSWSPTTGKFTENQLNIPDGSNIALAKSYLTYLYLVDKSNNQIYRYPRAAGGFGEKTNWLKDSVDLSQVSDMAISENIYLANGQNLTKLSKGKKQDFQIEPTATPIEASKVYAKRNSQNIYILDKTNSRIIKTGLDGNIISQFYHPDISQTIDFTVSEKNNIICFSKKNEFASFIMN